jgi:hypothetical protein
MCHRISQMSSSSSSSSTSSSSSSSSTDVTNAVAAIANNSQLRTIANRYGLDINTITWEDMGRYKGSSAGPAISDLTLKLAKSNRNLPIIRNPNFADRTADMPIGKFNVTVGNETKDTPLKSLPFKDFLENKGGHLKGTDGKPLKSLYCEAMDKNLLTSAQYCILPLNSGTCDFNVNLFNYQTSDDESAVLVVVGSQQGTSSQTIKRGTTALYFNNAGSAADYVAERLKEERARLGKNTEAAMDADEKQRNALFIYQIPLKVTPRVSRYSTYSSTNGDDSNGDDSNGGSFNIMQCLEMEDKCSVLESLSLFTSSNATRSISAKGMDNAMIRAGVTHSKFLGIDKSTVERDERFPIRVTIQLYKVTDDPNLDPSAFEDMAANIIKIYSVGEAEGSLVVDGDTGRSTEWDPKGLNVPFTKPVPVNGLPLFAF